MTTRSCTWPLRFTMMSLVRERTMVMTCSIIICCDPISITVHGMCVSSVQEPGPDKQISNSDWWEQSLDTRLCIITNSMIQSGQVATIALYRAFVNAQEGILMALIRSFHQLERGLTKCHANVALTTQQPTSYQRCKPIMYKMQMKGVGVPSYVSVIGCDMQPQSPYIVHFVGKHNGSWSP